MEAEEGLGALDMPLGVGSGWSTKCQCPDKGSGRKVPKAQQGPCPLDSAASPVSQGPSTSLIL